MEATKSKLRISQAEYLRRANYIIENKALTDDEKMIALLDLAASIEITDA